MNGGKGVVLVVDDDASLGKVLTALLRQAGYDSVHASDGETALEIMRTRAIDVVLTDMRMPGMDGLELLGRIAEGWPGLPVVMLTAHGTVPLAVEAMKAGAADFMLKPFDRDEVLFAMEKAVTSSRYVADRPEKAPHVARGIVGESKPMRDLAGTLEKAARSQATVLVRGESGTGKELVARAVHDASTRSGGPFVVVNCAALPENLLEAELFGYEKGAFTGAMSNKPGRATLADGGTLFLDEIGEIPLSLQPKLLRLIQERELTPLGGTSAQKVDVRFVVATHRALEEMVEAGTFREDLFYRLDVLSLWLPPLRERRGDIAILARHFCGLHARENGRPELKLEGAALELLAAQPWPGNVRELSNFVERLVILSDGPTLGVEDVESQLDRVIRPSVPGGAGDPEATLEKSRKQAEREALEAALERSNGNRTKAARILGISRRTLYNKLASLGVA